MTGLQRAARIGAAALFVSVAGACSATGGLGNVLGSVLGGGTQQVSGAVQGVDTRSQVIFIQQSNGQTVSVGYDNRTQVVYQNQTYGVTSLERGDQVTARVQSSNTSGSSYYTDYIQVDQSVSGTGSGVYGGVSGNVQSFQGNVRQIDYNNGWFTLNTNVGVITVTLPYNTSRNDVSRFQSLRSGDFVRLYGVYVTNNRVDLRNFY